MYFLFSIIISLISGSDIKISNSWIRPGAQGMNSAVYFTVKNNSDNPDSLYDAKCDVSKVVELHETYKSGDMMGMRKTEFVVINAKSSFSFKPGAHHVMLIDLKKKLRIGEKYKCTFYFRKAGAVTVEAVVKR